MFYSCTKLKSRLWLKIKKRRERVYLKLRYLSNIDTPEVVYDFICPCKENYIGQINRPLNKRPLPAW